MKKLNTRIRSNYINFTDNRIDIIMKRAVTATLILAHKKGDAHVVSCLGTIQILCNLFTTKFSSKTDDLIISKGHAALGLYAVLNEFGIIKLEDLKNFREENSEVAIHVTNSFSNYSRLASGSLGHGIGFGAGLALGKKLHKKKGYVYVIVGDGELNEGSNFEALQLASKLELNNLIVIVDHNNVQAVANYHEISGKAKIKNKFTAFNWTVKESKISQDLRKNIQVIDHSGTSPQCIIFFSHLDKVLPEVQSQVLWHYRRPDKFDVENAFRVLNSEDIAPDYVDWFRNQ